jgi:hypothetical protein
MTDKTRRKNPMNCWEMLSIEPTKDMEVIKGAFATLSNSIIMRKMRKDTRR